LDSQLGYGTWQAAPGEVGNGVYEALKIGYKHLVSLSMRCDSATANPSRASGSSKDVRTQNCPVDPVPTEISAAAALTRTLDILRKRLDRRGVPLGGVAMEL